MPTQKDFKRLVRRRMSKTGESYTSARAHLLERRARRPDAEPPTPLAADLAGLAGMSDAAIASKTGRDWKSWVEALDGRGGRDMSHRALAELVQRDFDVEDWWAQTVTVGYERIIGLRAIGQRRGGGYEATKSRTFSAPLARLYRAFAAERERRVWLPARITVRTARTDKSMRVVWEDGTRVQLNFYARGQSRAQVAVQHTHLPDAAARERMKAYWSERLDDLAKRLDGAKRQPVARRRTPKKR